MRVTVLWFVSESIFQDELETMPLCPILSICDWINQLLAIQAALLRAEYHQSTLFHCRR